MPRPDRGRQPAHQRGRPAGRRRAGPGETGRRGARCRFPARPAPRRAVHDQGLARHGGRRHDGRHRGLARPRPRSRRDRRREAAGGGRDPAGQVEHARVHLGERDRQRGLRPDLEPVRPRPDHRRQQRRLRRRSWPPAARRSTSAATAATASASRPTCAASRGSSRPAAACRGPGTGRGTRGCSSRSRSSARSPVASRTSSSSCRSSRARTGRTRTSSRRRSGMRGRSTSAGLRVAWFDDNGIRTPTPETIAAVRLAVAAIAATGATVEEQVPPDIADARPAWEAVIRADGFAWLWRLIAAAGTPGHGSYDTFGWVVRPGGRADPRRRRERGRRARRHGPKRAAALDAAVRPRW